MKKSRNNDGAAKKWDYKGCLQILYEEIALLKRIAASQDEVSKAVLARAWTDFDAHIEELNRLSAEFEALEAKRMAAFAALGSKDRESPEIVHPTDALAFYTLVTKLPEEERRELSEAYRNLKIETLRMKAANENFLQYLREARTIVAAFVEAVFPERGTKIYSRRGTQIESKIPSMVLNRSF